MVKRIAAVCMTVMFCLFTPAFAGEAGNKPCPWTITSIKVGKWGNGSEKARIWVQGSFPIPAGVSERPVWSVNGNNVGHSEIFFGEQALPNASYLLNEGDNSVEVKFVKPPYNGAINVKPISGFSWDKVPNGGYKTFK